MATARIKMFNNTIFTTHLDPEKTYMYEYLINTMNTIQYQKTLFNGDLRNTPATPYSMAAATHVPAFIK